jgi:hypothetical protein
MTIEDMYLAFRMQRVASATRVVICYFSVLIAVSLLSIKLNAINFGVAFGLSLIFLFELRNTARFIRKENIIHDAIKMKIPIKKIEW